MIGHSRTFMALGTICTYSNSIQVNWSFCSTVTFQWRDPLNYLYICHEHHYQLQESTQLKMRSMQSKSYQQEENSWKIQVFGKSHQKQKPQCSIWILMFTLLVNMCWKEQIQKHFHLKSASPIKQQGTWSPLLETNQTGSNRGGLLVGAVLVDAEEMAVVRSCMGN